MDRASAGELESAGVETLTVPSEAQLQVVLEQLRPAVVLHHWWRNTLLAGAIRNADERWICIGHTGLPMPFGYDSYVANSAFQRQLQSHLPPTRVVTIPPGVDLRRFQLPAPRRSRPVTIAMLSRLEHGKFPRRLLDHLPRLDDARVLIAGFGPRRWELEPEIRERGLERKVRFVGPVRSADVPRFLARADIGLHLTSRRR